MENEIVNKIVGWGIPFLLGEAVSVLALWFTFFKSFRNGLQCLLRAEIVRQHEKWTKVGYCPIYAKEALSREYKAYHALKGNDVATGLYEEIMDLPERKEYL